MSRKKGEMSDPVLSPDHYTQGDIETIDAIRDALGPEGFVAFCRGQVMKYIWRCEYKGKMEEDLQKAYFYCSLAIGIDPR